MPLFFLSYARSDAGVDLTRLYEDLGEELRRLSGEADPVGFRDEESIEPGTRWPEKLAAALRTTRAFVPLYSPTYFTREHCGREWACFERRLRATTAAGGSTPPLIVPILWDSLDFAQPPSVAMKVQYTHKDFGRDYAHFGLRYIMRLREFADIYHKFIHRFSMRILEAIHDFPLEPAVEIEPFEQLKSAFQVQMTSASVSKSDILPKGAKAVRFLVIAGSTDELQQIRNDISAYGYTSTDWKPCLPKYEGTIGPLLQGTAAEEGLMSDFLHRSGLCQIQNLRAKLDEAKKHRNIVVMIADNWSLLIEAYAELAREFDAHGHYNATALVPWNKSDQELLSRRKELLQRFEQVFENYTGREESPLMIWTSGADELREAIRSKLIEIRRRILATSTRRMIRGFGPSNLPQIKL